MARKKKEENYELSNYQLAIIDFIRNGQGNLVVEASAGSGKTYTLMKCVEEIPGDKSILLSAFNRDIATVLKRKAKDMFNVNVSTLHGLGLQMLQRNFPNEDLILECLFNNFQRDLDSPMGALIIDKKSEKRNQYYIYTYTEIIDEHYKKNCTEKKSMENKKNIKKINNIENKTYETKDLIELMINPELEEYKEKRPNYTKSI